MAQDITQLAKLEYDNLLISLQQKEKEVADIKKKLHPLGIFLKESGIIEKEARKREKK